MLRSNKIGDMVTAEAGFAKRSITDKQAVAAAKYEPMRRAVIL
jgi:hypothetical protein